MHSMEMSEIRTSIKNKELVQKRREQIVRAAIKQFSKKGFHKTTLRELAEEAGISAGAIYEYVRSKEDILSLIHDFAANLAEEVLTRSVEDVSDPIEKLRRMVRAEFNLMAEWADAIMLIYQESHILHPTFLKKLLKKEREHLAKFETVIEECIRSGLCKKCNARIYANLIKSMIDTWVIKRWDLRGHADRLEAERSILELVLRGMFKKGNLTASCSLELVGLQNKGVLIIHAGTALGSAISDYLSSNGANVCVCIPRSNKSSLTPYKASKSSSGIKTYYADRNGQAPAKLLDRIKRDLGAIDLYIQDLGRGETQTMQEDGSSYCVSSLEANLHCAESIIPSLQERLSRMPPGRIILVAPWGWDLYAEPVSYEIVKAGAAAMTRSVAGKMSSVGININCIVPGFIKTAQPIEMQEEMGKEALGRVNLGVLGEISDVIDGVIYLAGDASKYITGQVLEITGGAFLPR
jgi:3-oxoacyl-[acyl-carrier protein] reductase